MTHDDATMMPSPQNSGFDNAQRQAYFLYSCLMVAIYPIGVPLFVLVQLLKNRDVVETLIKELKSETELVTVEHLSKRRSFDQSLLILNPTTSGDADNLLWLAKRFQNYSCWWTGPFLVVIRLCQTSLLCLCANQMTMSALASTITLFALLIVNNYTPYRRSSE